MKVSFEMAFNYMYTWLQYYDYDLENELVYKWTKFADFSQSSWAVAALASRNLSISCKLDSFLKNSPEGSVFFVEQYTIVWQPYNMNYVLANF